MLKVPDLTSTKTGTAPQYLTLLAVAIKEWLTVITSSPCLTPTAKRARCKAVVQLEAAHAYFAPTKAANSSSNAATSGPWVTQPERIARLAASASCSPIHGLAIGMKRLLSNTSPAPVISQLCTVTRCNCT